MGLQTLTGNDTFIINDIPLILDTANGDVVTLEYSNDIVTLTTGKNKNTVYAKNEAGANVDVTCKFIRGSKADLFLNGLLTNQDKDFAGFRLMDGAFIKRMGDGKSKITFDTYAIQGMVFTKNVSAKSNTEGDGEQGTVTYTLKGALSTRGLT